MLLYTFVGIGTAYWMVCLSTENKSIGLAEALVAGLLWPFFLSALVIGAK